LVRPEIARHLIIICVPHGEIVKHLDIIKHDLPSFSSSPEYFALDAFLLQVRDDSCSVWTFQLLLDIFE